ncbi:MAG: ATP-dependent DNA ligase [Tepidisphaera sp.]|nr:ATP-dependent DNA ligase [Tepidisphaera sp.]
MKRLAALYDDLDATNSTNAKVDAMASYFKSAPPADAAWGLFLLTGQKLKRLLPSRAIADWVRAATNTPDWLFRECYSAVGDLAETVCLLLDSTANIATSSDAPSEAPDTPLHEWIDRAQHLRTLDEPEQRAALLGWLAALPGTQRFLLLKMITGSLRVGVSRTLVERAIAKAANIPKDHAAHLLAGDWKPTPAFFEALMRGEGAAGDAGEASRPYPFFLASPIDTPPSDDTLGPTSQWLLEWKWDGIRAQLIRRGVSTHLWSRGDELLTPRFPEIVDAAARLPGGTVLDGEVLAWKGDAPLGFAALQRRIGRTALSPRILSNFPAAFIAYDLLEEGGFDLRQTPLRDRRARLEQLLTTFGSSRLRLSQRVDAPTWDSARSQRELSRERGVEGLMLKRLDSAYASGRTRGDWWKWKIDPYTFDAVMTHAEPGHGRRAGLLTDYTFAVWDQGKLVPVTRAYSGLTHDEIKTLDAWIHRNTTGRYGRAREVKPERVFEIAFEGIAASTRHKSGVALRFPRISRIRDDKPAREADTLDTLRALLKARHGEAKTDQQLGLFGEDA